VWQRRIRCGTCKSDLEVMGMYERFSLMIGRLLAADLRDLKREDGQTVTEYGLVLAFVAILLAAVLVTLSGGISDFINLVDGKLQALPGF
jgi:Flp pilus assembly pilin Flp